MTEAISSSKPNKVQRITPRYRLCAAGYGFFYLNGGRMTEYLKKRFFLFIISLVERQYIGKRTEQASTVVDCCVYIKDAIVTPR